MTKDYVVCSNCLEKFEIDEVEYTEQLKEFKKLFCNKCILLIMKDGGIPPKSSK